MDLQRRKQELLDKQLQQQRVLIERLEKNKSTIKTDERAAVMQTVRNLQETIEKLKKDLQHTAMKETPSPTSAAAPSLPVKTPEEAKKRFSTWRLSSTRSRWKGRTRPNCSAESRNWIPSSANRIEAIRVSDVEPESALGVLSEAEGVAWLPEFQLAAGWFLSSSHL